MRKGVAWPNPRFTDNGNGTVTDNLTGLIWLKRADEYGWRTWSDALSDCATLNSGEHGLTDGSNEGDWRLPNVQELQSLSDCGRHNPALCDTAGTGQWSEGDPFSNVQSWHYWSRTTSASIVAGLSWWVGFGDYWVGTDNKTNGNKHVWPVRGGE